MIPIGGTINRDIQKSMMRYIPNYYYDSFVVGEIIRVDAIELETLNSDIDDVLNQFFVETATWGLNIWEKIAGIPINPPGKTNDQRRSLIISKLRGIGVVNVTLIQNVAQSFTNGEVDVTDDPSTYSIKITFVGTRGQPDNIDGIKAAINAIIPAHIGATYVLTYLSWSELETNNLIFNTEDTYTWDGLEVAFLAPSV